MAMCMPATAEHDLVNARRRRFANLSSGACVIGLAHLVIFAIALVSYQVICMNCRCFSNLVNLCLYKALSIS